ncbi:hypothetical protein AB0M95_33595 [Sphaerisporangium sp. NPDC051017]|uniref:MurR/RpiR family transcriptional regulator n=1 Tax=Sphaerisporangium sp. NPDC051017 TaxID=3154636 RepID=UPI00342EC11A
MSVAGGAATSSSVAERIRGRMGQLSAGERKVARALLAHYPSAGLGSTHELAQRAGVSAPTVVVRPRGGLHRGGVGVREPAVLLCGRRPHALRSLP